MNDVPVDYYSGIDMATGRRTDEAQRPELSFGSVEYVAPTEYMVGIYCLPTLVCHPPSKVQCPELSFGSVIYIAPLGHEGLDVHPDSPWV